MFGIALIAIGEFFAEIGISIGRFEALQKRESLYAMAFLNTLWATIFLLGVALFTGNFTFRFESLPLSLFLIRAVLEIGLVFITLNAVLAADRSTFSFLRILTIPLLLFVDTFLGYSISWIQVLGISAIVIALIFLLLNHGLSKRGKVLSLLSSLLAVGTISLYKYNITHFNSVEAEQALMHLIILITVIIAAKIRLKENVFRYLSHRVFLVQSVTTGIASVCISFAFVFAPASIIAATKRSFEVFASIISGRGYFHEKHIGIKLAAFALIVLGITVLVV